MPPKPRPYYGPSVLEMAELRLRQINAEIRALEQEREVVKQRIEKYSKESNP